MSSSIQALKEGPVRYRTAPARIAGPSTDRVAPSLRGTAGRELTAGSDLFRPGEPCTVIYYLTEGCLFLYDLLEDGRRQILHFALPGAVLGLYPKRITIYGAQALTDTTVHTIPQERLGSLLQDHPKAGLQLMWSVWKERNLAYDHLTSIGKRSSRECIARLLLELYVRFRMQWPYHNAEEMHLPLTQEHIGDATGLTNVHVNRVLRQLRGEGIAEFHYKRLRIMNPDKLADVAGVDPGLVVWGCQENSPDDMIAAFKIGLGLPL
jgi:CRP-like cAMP-binding protein